MGRESGAASKMTLTLASGSIQKLMATAFTSGATETSMKESGQNVSSTALEQICSAMATLILENTRMVDLTERASTLGPTVLSIKATLSKE